MQEQVQTLIDILKKKKKNDDNNNDDNDNKNDDDNNNNKDTGFILLDSYNIEQPKNNSLIRVDPSQNQISRLAPSPESVLSTEYASDPVRRVYYLVESPGGEQIITGINADSGKVMFRSSASVENWNGIECHVATGNLIGTRLGRDFIQFFEIIPHTGEIAWRSSPQNVSGSITIDASTFDSRRSIYYQQFSDLNQNPYLFAVDAKTHDIDMIATEQPVVHLAFDHIHERLLGQADSRPHSYSIIDLKSGNLTEIVSSSFNGAVETGGVVLDSENQTLYAALIGYGKHTLVSVDLSTGKLTHSLSLPTSSHFAAFFTPK
eukprot:gb/GECH01004524.1/.p1 GENE.gb/GECH01004524.1/~~gb/GECH01004524.1/.p1  ORF type:complete len:319 (+),score=97.84 gb/GECH01004524.1/:1-957(+)